MYANELTKSVTEKYRALNNARVRRTLAKYPDAGWNFGHTYGLYNYTTKEYQETLTFTGEVYVGEVPKEEVDLSQIATDVSNDGYVYNQTMESYELTGKEPVKVKVILYATQRFTGEEVKLLKGLNILQKQKVIPHKTKAYTTTVLACAAR